MIAVLHHPGPPPASRSGLEAKDFSTPCPHACLLSGKSPVAFLSNADCDRPGAGTLCGLQSLIQAWDTIYLHGGTAKKGSIQGLAECVDLIVVSARGKRHEFFSKVIEPRRQPRKMHAARLDPSGVSVHTHDLFLGRLHRDGANALSLEVLDQAHARTLILDQQGVAVGIITPATMLIDDLPPQIRVIKPLTHDIQNKGIFAFEMEDDTRRIVGQLPSGHRGIPADDGVIAHIPKSAACHRKRTRPT